MIPNRKKWIPVQLTVYLILTVYACVKLPAILSDAGDRAASATVLAPLALPEDMQQRLEDHTADDADSEVAVDVTPDDTGNEAESETTEVETNDDSGSEPEEEKDAPQVSYIVTRHAGSSVHIRAAASSQSEILTLVYDGDPVTVLSVSGNWYQVQTDEIVGYVYKDYLSDHE